MNPITWIDGYKLDHRRQYPAGTTKVLANWTPRATRVPGIDRVTFFGLQGTLDYLMRSFQRDFFGRTKARVCRDYQRRVDGYLGPSTIGTAHIAELHGLGYLPLDIRAVPEGSAVPLRVPMLTIENTHPAFFWLPNYLETILSSMLWLPCTSATMALHYRRLLDAACARTGGDPAFVPWQGHDFSFRGMEGLGAASASGAAHLLAFTGTDTIPALDYIERFYGPIPTGTLLGGSVAATEHSVMCAGSQAGERETFERLLDLYPSGVVSVVSDTWDLWTVLADYLPALKARIMARDGKLVIRPDSGDPADILCGDPDAEPDTPAAKGVVRLLWETFGGAINAKGFRVLDSHIGAIYGDSITIARATDILGRLEASGFASTNVVLGIGSYTYQYVTRDTHGFAMKATWCESNGIGVDIFKSPKTDDGTKHSAKGRLAVLDGPTGPVLVSCASAEQEARSMLTPVWRDGAFVRRDSFDVVRARALAQRGV